MAMSGVTVRPPSLAAGRRGRPAAAAAGAATTTRTVVATTTLARDKRIPSSRRATLVRARATSPERANNGSSSGGGGGAGGLGGASSSSSAHHHHPARAPSAAAAAGGGAGGGGGESATAEAPELLTSLADLDALRARLTARLAATVDEAEQLRVAPQQQQQQQQQQQPSAAAAAAAAAYAAPPPAAARPPPPLAPSPPPSSSSQPPPPFHRLPSPNSPTSPENVARRLAAAAAPLTSASSTDDDNGATAAASSSSSWHPSLGWRPAPHHLPKELLWDRIRAEAKAWAEAEPALASFLYSSVLVHPTIERALAFVLGNKLASPTLFSTHLMKMIGDAYAEDPSLVEAAVADLQAVYDRDPACEQYAQCLLLFKGFAAVQCHRVAHHLWTRGRRALAVALQSRVSEAFHVDAHPAAWLGRGVMIDHATGVVIGETAVVGDNVSMLHHVTLGGSGTRRGVRHPTVGHGVLLGAGVSVLGPVTVGAGCKVGAGSVVVADLPPHSVAVGVPARVVKVGGAALEPVADMDQTEGFTLDYVI